MELLFWQVLAIILFIVLSLTLIFRPKKTVRISYNGGDEADMNEKLYVVPADEGTRKYGGWLLNELCRRFTLKPQSGIVFRLPDEAYNQQQNQFYATPILSKLELLKGSDYEMILAMTEEDLYVPSHNYIMGQANSASRTAIVSIFRLKPEFYGLPEDENLLRDRLLNVACHEVGHMLGLRNCKNSECQMHPAETVADIDNRPETFCAECVLNLTIPSKVKI
jgi:archaemetzincin